MFVAFVLLRFFVLGNILGCLLASCLILVDIPKPFKNTLLFNGFRAVVGPSWRQVDGLGRHVGSKLWVLGNALGPS